METRVEKYAKYREEIQNSFNDMTTKEKTSERVQKILNNTDSGRNIALSDVMEAYEIYDQDDGENDKHKISVNKRKVLFTLFFLLIIIGLVVAMIIVGIKAFGGM